MILQSDNGYLHGEHGIFNKNVPWDRSVRVPLIIRGPGLEPGAVREDLTANVDLPRTILDAAGVAPPLPQDGYSLLRGHRRKFLLLEKESAEGGSKFAPWRQIKTASGWTYWRLLDRPREFLFDLDRDPQQLHNRVQREPERAQRLRRRAARYADCAAPCP